MNKISEPNETNYKPRILIVDRNGGFTHSASSLLQNTHQYVVCKENDARRTLETARSFKPDLILLNLIMPDTDTTEIAAEITADSMLHSVPIVFVTALITPEEARHARRIDGHRMVPKPITSSELIKLVEESLPGCCDDRKERASRQKCPAIQATKRAHVGPAYRLGTTRTRAALLPTSTAVNDGRSIRNILIHDNDPASLRLLRDVYLGPAGSTFSQYCLVIVALLILALANAIVWFR